MCRCAHIVLLTCCCGRAAGPASLAAADIDAPAALPPIAGPAPVAAVLHSAAPNEVSDGGAVVRAVKDQFSVAFVDVPMSEGVWEWEWDMRSTGGYAWGFAVLSICPRDDPTMGWEDARQVWWTSGNGYVRVMGTRQQVPIPSLRGWGPHVSVVDGDCMRFRLDVGARTLEGWHNGRVLHRIEGVAAPQLYAGIWLWQSMTVRLNYFRRVDAAVMIGGGGGGGGGGAGASGDEWTCAACTLINGAGAATCAVCDASQPSSGGAADGGASARAALDTALAALPGAPDLPGAIEAVAAALARVRAAHPAPPEGDGALKAALVAAGRAAVARRGTDEWQRVAPAFGRLLQSLRAPG